MNFKSLIQKATLACLVSMLVCPTGMAMESGLSTAVVSNEQVLESTMPSTYKDDIKPEMAAKYNFTYDGEFTAASKLPTYAWMPVGVPLKAIVVGIHGLTLHGRRYRVLGRVCAVNGIGFVSMDMRGFGRCKFDTGKRFSTTTDDRTRVSHEKSYQEIVQLVSAVKRRFPDQSVFVMGESLGCTFAVRLAAEHKNLVDGIILSAPAVKVNPKMYVGHGNLARGVKATIAPSHSVNLNAFMRNLVSPRPEVVSEMLDDPLILKSLPLISLISTDDFVDKTSDWGKGVSSTLPVLITQGGIDNCVSAKHVTDLTNSMPSNDQTIAWRGNYGHLQLETIFVRASILNALVNWMHDHGIDQKSRQNQVQEQLTALGGQLVK